MKSKEIFSENDVVLDVLYCGKCHSDTDIVVHMGWLHHEKRKRGKGDCPVCTTGYSEWMTLRKPASCRGCLFVVNDKMEP